MEKPDLSNLAETIAYLKSNPEALDEINAAIRERSAKKRNPRIEKTTYIAEIMDAVIFDIMENDYSREDIVYKLIDIRNILHNRDFEFIKSGPDATHKKRQDLIANMHANLSLSVKDENRAIWKSADYFYYFRNNETYNECYSDGRLLVSDAAMTKEIIKFLKENGYPDRISEPGEKARYVKRKK